MREGAALLQGLATCGKCGRRLHTHYQRQNRFAWLSLLRQGYRSGTRRVLSQLSAACKSIKRWWMHFSKR